MIIATLKEINENENRVAISPDTCNAYVKKGLKVLVEKDSGLNSSFLNKDYEANGGKVISKDEIIKNADILLCVCSLPNINDLKNFKENITIIGMFNPYENFKNLRLLEQKSFTLHFIDFGQNFSKLNKDLTDFLTYSLEQIFRTKTFHHAL